MDKQEDSFVRNDKEKYISDVKPPKQRSAATESSTSEGRRKYRDAELRNTKIPRTIKTQPSSSTPSSSKFPSREQSSNIIVINGQTYEKVK